MRKREQRRARVDDEGRDTRTALSSLSPLVGPPGRFVIRGKGVESAAAFGFGRGLAPERARASGRRRLGRQPGKVRRRPEISKALLIGPPDPRALVPLQRLVPSPRQAELSLVSWCRT